MHIILIVLAILAGIIALLLITALFTRKDYAVSREIVIAKPSGDVFQYVKLLKNQPYFSKWVMRDPDHKRDFTGTDGTVGFIYAWNGNKQGGEGEQEIKQLTEGKRVDLEIRFVRPFAAIAQAYFAIDALSANQTKLRWGFNSAMPYPMNIMLVFMNVDKLMGADLDESLKNVKNILEK